MWLVQWSVAPEGVWGWLVLVEARAGPEVVSDVVVWAGPERHHPGEAVWVAELPARVGPEIHHLVVAVRVAVVHVHVGVPEVVIVVLGRMTPIFPLAMVGLIDVFLLVP